jgi:hypothetical protein
MMYFSRSIVAVSGSENAGTDGTFTALSFYNWRLTVTFTYLHPSKNWERSVCPSSPQFPKAFALRPSSASGGDSCTNP